MRGVLCIKFHLSNIFFSVICVLKLCTKLSIIQLLNRILLGLAPFGLVFSTEKLFSGLIISFQDNKNFNQSYMWCFIIALINFFVFYLNSKNAQIQQKITFDFEKSMKSNLLIKSKNISFQMFESSHFQNKYMRALQSHNSILTTFEGFLMLLQTFISLISIVFYLINVHIFFILIVFVMIVPLIILELRFGLQNYELGVDLTENSRKISYFEGLLVNKNTLKGIRIDQNENSFIRLWKSAFDDNRDAHLSLNSKQLYATSKIQLVVSISFILATILSVHLISINLIILATLTAIIQAVQNLQGIVPSFANNLSNTYQSSLNIKEFRSFLFHFEENKECKEHIKNIDSISVRNLNYNYANSEISVLKNINFDIYRGEKIAIMGNNGSGKSTLVKCLTGLYDTENSIFINEKIPIEVITKDSLWSQLSVLFQDFNKYELSILENIFVENEETSNSDVDRLIELVGMKSAIEKMERKAATQVGTLFEDGKELSGGQWQKIAIARALYQNSTFLFLDEPTSALDPDSEFQILYNLLSNLEKTSIIYITHRVNVAKLADKVIYMENGEILECGSHEELMAKKGEYRRIYEKQVENLIGKREDVSYV